MKLVRLSDLEIFQPLLAFGLAMILGCMISVFPAKKDIYLTLVNNLSKVN